VARHEGDALARYGSGMLPLEYESPRPSAPMVAYSYARSREALRFLQEQFRRHSIDREYLALVEGAVRRPGVFDAPLVADRGDRRRGVARPGEPGKHAVTRYRPIETFDRATLVSVRLETGRTHQVRVHFSASGHPVVGDSVYRRREVAVPGLAVRRQMLHAHVLGFDHPGTGERVRATSPLPGDFQEALRFLRPRRASAPKPPQKTNAPIARGVLRD